MIILSLQLISLSVDDSKNPPQYVEIEECDSAQCDLDPRKKYTATVTFVTPSSSKAAYFHGLNACKNLSECPFRAGEYITYKAVLTGKRLGSFELIDGARNTLVCFTL